MYSGILSPKGGKRRWGGTHSSPKAPKTNDHCVLPSKTRFSGTRVVGLRRVPTATQRIHQAEGPETTYFTNKRHFFTFLLVGKDGVPESP